MGSLRCRIHVSAVEAVSFIISESIGVVCAVESMCHPWKQFLVDFRVGSDSVFFDGFVTHMGCLHCRIHASPVEAVSLIIFESTRALCAVESMHHPSKQFG